MADAAIVTMSGGGLRAAALAQETMNRLSSEPTTCAVDTPGPCTLLINVIGVSGISGGNWYASYFVANGSSG